MGNSSMILVVDDIPANLEVACDILNDAGYEVATAIDGERALKRVQGHLPDLILLDVQMPGIDGFEVCRRLKADGATTRIPIIFMTALSDIDSKVQGLDLGAVDYITKPFQERELLARVRTHLQLSELTKTLEKTVSERTIAFDQLQRAQIQLVQSEKMSALGQMVAGVAHEINNPVNFIHGNISHLRQYSQELLRVIEGYQEQYPSPHGRLGELLREVNLEFLREDIPKLLDSARMGTDRIIEIVLSLRNFSRLDEAEFKQVNVHEGIESTLVILAHRLRGSGDRSEIRVICEYGELPLVGCYPGQLNQVFMNLISNAIDALQDQEESVRVIRIWTGMSSRETIAIHVADNGSGMTEQVRSRIFDPFFTTKPVGKGTGLGLSISYQIVTQTHKGSLYCSSTVGEGTEFCIEIPTQQPAVKSTATGQSGE